MSRNTNAIVRTSIQVPTRNHLRFLIGKGGKVIKSIKAKHGLTYANINQSERIYNIAGPKASVAAAAADINRHIEWINNINIEHTPKRVKSKPQTDENGWTTITPRRSESKKPVEKLIVQSNHRNQFKELEQEEDDAIATPTNSPVLKSTSKKKKKVTFAHDATGQDEIREFDKNEPASYVSSSDDAEPSDEDMSYFASKRTGGNAWRPRNRSQSPVPTTDESTSYIKSLRDHLKTGSPKPTRTPSKKSWADIADEDSSDDEEFDYTNTM